MDLPAFTKKNGSEFKLLEADFLKLKNAYPQIDVEKEIRAAALWHDLNPAKRKSNIMSFLSNWMKRAEPERKGWHPSYQPFRNQPDNAPRHREVALASLAKCRAMLK